MGLKEQELVAEIEEMEKAVFGTTEEVNDEAETDTVNSETTEETTKETKEATGASDTPQPNVEPDKEDDWKVKYDDLLFKYKKLRANSDRFKFDARTKIKGLEASVIQLEKTLREIPKPKEDIFKGTISKEEEEMLGEKAVEVIKRASQTASDRAKADLQVQLDAEKDKRLKAEQLQDKVKVQNANMNFLAKLKAAVPNYSEINLDPGFEKFIYDNDPINGGQRITYFRQAESNGDVATLARYMLEYSSLAKPVDPLAEKVTPTGGGTPVAPQETTKETLAYSDMIKFYDDITSGKYKGKASLQAKHQLKWDNALEGGLIDMEK